MNVSRRGVELVAQFEGFRSKPYQDAVGVWTIGYGHTHGLVAKLKGKTPPWTHAKALRVLRRELDNSYASAIRALNLPLTQDQFDALVSFVYNLGPGAIAPNTGVGRALRAHDWKAAADHMLEWDKAGGRSLPGLTRRRQAERALFLKKGA